MRLSEAIRLGAAMKPQGFGKLNYKGKTCALGAALDAIGLHDFDERLPLLWRRFLGAEPPTLKTLGACNQTVIEYLNDTYLWNRAQIADWVEEAELAFYGPTVEEMPREEEGSPMRDWSLVPST